MENVYFQSFRTSTVGLPRESKISRAKTLFTEDIAMAVDEEAAAPKADARSGVAGEKAQAITLKPSSPIGNQERQKSFRKRKRSKNLGQ